MGHGLLQGLIALDSYVAVTPGPVGRADLITIPWTSEDKLRHSLVHDSPEAVAAIIQWVQRLLLRASFSETSTEHQSQTFDLPSEIARLRSRRKATDSGRQNLSSTDSREQG